MPNPHRVFLAPRRVLGKTLLGFGPDKNRTRRFFVRKRTIGRRCLKHGKAGARVKITSMLECKQRNYVTNKNKKNTPDRLERNKYLPLLQEVHAPHRDQVELAEVSQERRCN